MNEFKRCMNVFTHSPFKVRLMLLNMLCDMFNAKPRQDDNPSRSAASRYAASFPRHPYVVNWPVPDYFCGFAAPFAKHLFSNC